DQRWAETCAAMRVFGTTAVRLGVDDRLDASAMLAAMERQFNRFSDVDRVWAPALEGGHPHHDLVHQFAVVRWGYRRCRFYNTYSKREPSMSTDGQPVLLSPFVRALKREALACYAS